MVLLVLVDTVDFVVVVDFVVMAVVLVNWVFVFDRLDVGVGVQLSPGTVQLKKVKVEVRTKWF